MSTRPRALVIGGSVGGLFSAILLRSIGWEASVFERAHGDLGDRGAAIGLTDALTAVMRRIGVEVDPSMTVETHSRICLDRGGAIVHEAPLRGMTSAWGRLYRPLRAALPAQCYHAGAVLARVEQDAEGVTAVFADGSRARGDLLVGADGIHSAARRQFLPDLQPRYAGYVVWRAVVSEHEMPPPVRAKIARIFHHMTFCFPREGMVLGLPMPGSDANQPRRYQLAWFRPADQAALLAMCTDADGRQHGVSIAPPRIRRELITQLRASAAAEIAPELAALLAATAQPILQPIFDLETPRLAFGRVVLLGDAAFVARPHVAAGITKAALDAARLADALAAHVADVDAALLGYERDRIFAGSQLVARGRYLGAFLEPQSAGVPRSRHWHPEIIIREYGAAGVIDDKTTAQTA
jgi:2-polyprenyl-6-methoxyphenol hydroxylase-like FAD-dependent oxidoreductase